MAIRIDIDNYTTYKGIGDKLCHYFNYRVLNAEL